MTDDLRTKLDDAEFRVLELTEEVERLAGELRVANDLFTLVETDAENARKIADQFRTQIATIDSFVQYVKTQEATSSSLVFTERLATRVFDLRRLSIILDEVATDKAHAENAYDEFCAEISLITQEIQHELMERATVLRESEERRQTFEADARQLRESLRFANAQVAAVQKELDAARAEEATHTEQSADAQMAQRVRNVASALYERSLAIPRLLRVADLKFVRARNTFQNARATRSQLYKQILDDHVAEQIDILYARVTQDLEVASDEDLNTLRALLERVRQFRKKLDEAEQLAESGVESIRDARTDYRKLCEQCAELRTEVIKAKSGAALFDLPCPPEVLAQFDETTNRLTLIGGEDQAERHRSMMSLDPVLADRPASIQLLFEQADRAQAVILTINPNPSALFSDAPSPIAAVSRLLIMAIDEYLGDDSVKGYGRGTLIDCVLKSGLVSVEFQPLLLQAFQDISHLLERTRFKTSFTFRPSAQCSQIAKGERTYCVHEAAVIAALIQGKKRVWTEKYAGRKASSAQ